MQTHLPSAHDRRLRAHRPAAHGGQRSLFHRGEPKSSSRVGRGLRALGGQGGPAISTIDRSDHPARDEDCSGLIARFAVPNSQFSLNVSLAKRRYLSATLPSLISFVTMKPSRSYRGRPSSEACRTSESRFVWRDQTIIHFILSN